MAIVEYGPSTSRILWGYRITKRSSTEESPFGLSFGYEAALPIELEFQNLRIQSYDEHINDIGLSAYKDLMEELNDEVNKRICAYQHRVGDTTIRRFDLGIFYQATLFVRSSKLQDQVKLVEL